MNDEALLRVAALPGVADAVDAAREACTGLRWHPALRGRADQARAESTVRAGRASAAMDGAELPVDLVRDVLRGAVEAPDDAVGWVVTGALRATVEAGQVARVVRSAPLQALARLHTGSSPSTCWAARAAQTSSRSIWPAPASRCPATRSAPAWTGWCH